MRLPAHSVRDALTKLAALPVRERRALLIEPKRAEAIVGGCLVLQALCEYFALSEITVSESDILDALAASLFA
jgi:exopolyphosphatase/pppGpp-phosphohydrolase